MRDSTTADLQDLYRELILDHARNPRHFGQIGEATHVAEGINPLCGDKLKIYFRIDDQGNIVDAKFDGSGCAISVASASLLTDTVIGKSTAFASDFFSAVVNMLADSPQVKAPANSAINLGKLRALAGVREYPSRVKCATLAWHALNSALNHDHSPATTE